jgi:hypothetical protein
MKSRIRYNSSNDEIKIAWGKPRGKTFLENFTASRTRDFYQRRGYGAVGRQRQHPGSRDAFDEVQLERVEAFGAADAHL